MFQKPLIQVFTCIHAHPSSMPLIGFDRKSNLRVPESFEFIQSAIKIPLRNDRILAATFTAEDQATLTTESKAPATGRGNNCAAFR